MSGFGPGEELRATLHKRSDTLAALAERPRTKPELVEEVGPSRSTVDRSISELEECGCVQRIGSKYHLTPLGRISLEEYRSYTETMDDIYEAGTVINALPDTVSIPSAFLCGASVYVADPNVPESALQPSIELLADANRLTGLAPVALTMYPKILDDLVGENDLEVEVVIERSTLETLLELSQERLERLIQGGDLTFLVTDESLPYALWIIEQPEDTYAGITVYENGGVQGVLINDSEAALSWARETYRGFESTASQASLHARP